MTSYVDDNAFPKVILVEGAAPTSAASGQQKLFIDSADHKLKRVNSSGTVTTVEASGSGGDLTKIASTVLGSAAASITFSSIAGTYSALRLVVAGRIDESATDDWINLRFNADSGSNYDGVWISGNASAAASAGQNGVTAAHIGDFPGATGGANLPGIITLDIPFYAATTFYKQAVAASYMESSTTAGNEAMRSFGITWRSTAAITSVTFLPASGNFITGTSAVLWGLN